MGGGSARGEWGAGFAKHLSDSLGPYNTVFGTSTGALMAPLIVLNEFESLQKAYTSVTQKSIFNVNPFNKNTGELKMFPSAIRILFGSETFGKSENLRKLIDKFLTDDLYNRIRNSKDGLNFAVAVVNMRNGKAYYKSSRNIEAASIMKDWIWASGNEPLFMSYYDDKTTPEKEAFVDGGVLQNIPLLEALEYANKYHVKNIDVIINKPEYPLDPSFEKRNILKGLTRLIDMWSIQIRNDNLEIPLLKSKLGIDSSKLSALLRDSTSETVGISIYYFPPRYYTKLNQKELLFDKARMTELWNVGAIGEHEKGQTIYFDSKLLFNFLMEEVKDLKIKLEADD